MISKITSARRKNTPGLLLSPETISRAAQLSQSVRTAERKWSAYLRSLALSGFEQWLEQRAPDVPFRGDRHWLQDPTFASSIDAVCGLEAGAFSLCLVATPNADLPVAVPQGAIELAEFAAQFYVLVEVWEEEGWVRVWGGVSRDRLLKQIETRQLTANPNWTYLFPADAFELEPDDLLLQLRCLDADAIAQPVAEPGRSISPQLRAKLTAVGTQLLQSEPWQILSWEEAAMLLRDPEAMAGLSAPEIAPKPQPTQLQNWIEGILGHAWSLLGTFPPSARLQFCGQTGFADTLEHIRQDIAQLYASQPGKLASERVVPPNLSDGDALAHLIRSTDDEGIRRQAVDLLQQIEPGHLLFGATRERDLSLDFHGEAIALRVMVIPRWDERYSVLLRVYPTRDRRFLPAGLQLIVLDETGNELAAHTARDRDDWMDRPLIVEVGDRFGIRIALNESSVTETFVI